MDITGNPLVIDAADVAAVAVIVWTGNIHIYDIEFMGYTADADTCVLTRGNGKPLWQENGASDLKTLRSGHIGTVNGVKIAIGGITSGSVKIYFK
jgi:hypothetical protein